MEAFLREVSVVFKLTPSPSFLSYLWFLMDPSYSDFLTISFKCVAMPALFSLVFTKELEEEEGGRKNNEEEAGGRKEVKVAVSRSGRR